MGSLQRSVLRRFFRRLWGTNQPAFSGLASLSEREPDCDCHPAYHELGVHDPDWAAAERFESDEGGAPRER